MQAKKNWKKLKLKKRRKTLTKKQDSKKKLMKNISNQIGMNQPISLMTWASKKRFWEVFMDMVSINHLQFSRKVFSPSFKDMIQLLRRNLALVRPVLSQFQHCPLSIPPVCIRKLLLLLQQENFPCKVHLLCTPLVSTIKSKFTLVSEELVSEKISKFLKVEFMSLSERQVEFMIWWKKDSLKLNISDSLSWTRLMRCSLEDLRLKFKKYLSSYPETSKSLFSLQQCQTKFLLWLSTSWEIQRRSWLRAKT